MHQASRSSRLGTLLEHLSEVRDPRAREWLFPKQGHDR